MCASTVARASWIAWPTYPRWVGVDELHLDQARAESFGSVAPTARIIRHVDDTLAVAVEQGWGRRFEFVPLSLEGATALIGEQLLEIQPLSGGARNTNYRLLRVAQPEPVVLRIHTADPTACRREQRLLDLVKDSVPVPRVLRVGPSASPAWSLLTFVQGERFDHALSGASSGDVDRMAHSAGVALAHIHQ